MTEAVEFIMSYVLFSESFWIMEPLNPLFLLCMVLQCVLFGGLSAAVRKWDIKARKGLLAILMFITLVGFAVYKYYLSIDADYMVISMESGLGGFNWWGELPLQLCNINMILIPVACLSGNRNLQSFAFFMGPFGAAMALLMPSAGFSGYDFRLPRMLGFYLTHYMVFFGSLMLVTFGIYKPRYKDVLPMILTGGCLCVGIYLINMVLRWTGANLHANYFFLVETEGNSILDIFYQLIPIPLLYIVPILLILVFYALLIVTLFWIGDRLKRR